MKKTKITAMVLFLLCAIGVHAQNKWYVDSAATGANDGSSWANAFKYLSDATFAAQSGTTSDTIFVAKGTYYTNKVPYPSTTVFPNRDSAFIFTRNNLAVLGGYPTAGGVRNADANVTVLSGEIDPSNIFNSAYHIIIIAGANNVNRIDSTLVIDGFTITGTYKTFGTESNIIVNGQAIYNNRGGGIYNRYASPILSNNKIVKHSNDWGGGIYNIFSSPKILNASIKSISSGSGVGIFNDSMSSPTISSVLISGCSAPSSSVLYNYNFSSPVVTNTTIANNNSSGILSFNGCHAVLKNCIIYGNAFGVGGYTFGAPSTTGISYSDIQGSGGSGFGWSLTTATDLGNNVDIAPGFTAAVPYVQPSAAGNYRLFISSPLINKGDTVGVSQYLPNTDIIGNSRMLDSNIDMGAYEYVPPANKIYVDSSAVAGNNTGADWANAFTALSTATNWAVSRYVNIDTVLIAKGTYYPTGIQSSGARDTSFTFTRDNVALMGGFPSGGGSVRNWITNPTILSGDIGVANTNTDNSYHVVVAVGNGFVPLTNSLVFDGLRITSAYNQSTNGGGIVVRGQFVYRSYGGGIYNHYASPLIVNSSILSNNANYGGGMYNFHSTFKMINSSLKGNVAANGGAMYNDSLSGGTIMNSVITGNGGSAYGAAFFNKMSDVKLMNATIASNTCWYANAAMYNVASNPILKNSIFYGNDGASIFNDPFSAPVFSYSIVQNSGGSAAWVAATGIDSGHNLSSNPNFAAPVNNYGSGNINGNYQVQYGSPAIDAGDTTGVIQNLPLVDLWNNPRFAGNNIDMGAYEFAAPSHLIYVDSSATSGANNSTSWSDAFTTLSYATNLARVFPNVDTILVAKGTYYPTGLQSATNRDSSFVFTRDSLVVLGGYSTGGSIRNSKIYNTILSGNIGSSTVNNDNSHHVVVAVGTNGNPIDSTLKIDGFTITGGYANIDTGVVTVNNQPIARRIGGGMANFYASPVLSNMIFTKDTVTGNGGSMYNFHSSPIINNGLFTLNTANNGGAIFDTATSSPVIVSSIFRGNRANTNGAGIYNIVSSSPKILNCLFSGNNAASNGGAILNSTASSPTIVNTTISGNFAVNLGGGIINLATSVPVVKNTIIYANNSGITNVSSTPSISYSIVQDGGYAGSNHNINQNPLFQTPLIASNTPSLAGNFMVLGGSAIINVGDTTNVSPYLTATDLFGYPRILGSGIDIGAYEYVRALYVDSSVAINGTGTSWTDALRYLSDATNYARSNPAIDTIMVAKGTYYTTGVVNGTKRDSAFFFTTSKLLLLGGYPSGGGVRDWVANPTIMSGDLNVPNDTVGNAYHVLVAAGTSAVPLDSTLKFDGFTITGGNGMSNFNNYTVNGQLLQGNMGGGVVLAYAGPGFNNMVVTKNISGYGAGWYATNAPFTLSNSTISENKATYAYGGMSAGTTPKLINVSIIGNITNGSGVAGIYIQGGSMNNCLVKGNIGSSGAGGVSVSGTVAISNTTISDNTTMGNGGGIAITGTGTAAGVVLDKCIIKNNLSSGLVGAGGGIYTDHGAPKFLNCTISGNQAALSRYGGGMYNNISVPVIVNTLITGNKTDNIGAGIYNYQSSPIIVNSTIAGNSGSLPGAAMYNATSSFPSVRNTIISGNSSGVANAASLPVFKNSVVQGSGGSGASWVAATGTDGGNNSGKEGNFINPASYTLAPDTIGNYSITICSPAVNRGDTTGVGQYIPTTDYAGNIRYNGIIDAGAYEIDPLNPASMNVPVTGGIYTSTKSFQQGNLTHFCNCDSNKLLVTLDTIGTGVVLNDTAAKVRVGTAVAAYYQAGSGFVTNPDGTAVFNREWTVIPTVEPTSPVTVYTYYTDSDYVSVNNVLNSLMLTPLVSDTQMYFYKVTDTSLGLFPSIFSIGINQVQVITYAATPSISGWVAGTLGNNKYAEYQVSSFSGGGGGGSSEGSAPLSLDLLSFTGKAYDAYNLLNWETSENAISWELSRSNNGSDFTTLANGNTGIKSYKDAAPLKGMNYYRLKVNKNDGSSANSAIVMLNSNAKGGSVLIYPVPAKQHITMHCTNEVLIGQKVVVTDNAGRSIYSFTLHAEDNIDISSWATGMYHIQLSDGSSVKIVKD